MITKEVAQAETGAGVPLDYTIRYGLTADGRPALPAPATVTDTLPAGMTYVAGSGSLAAVVTGTPATGQTLTWTIQNVPVDKNPMDLITFKAITPPTAQPGNQIYNTAIIQSQGQTAQASTVSSVFRGGYTTLTKTAAAPTVAATNGVAEGSWTVRMTSADTTLSAITDTIDILPFKGDNRGTTFDGTYKLKQPI